MSIKFLMSFHGLERRLCEYGRMTKTRMVCTRFKQRRRIFVREWRKHRGLTLEQLGERVGMTQGNLSHLERGMIPYNQDTLEALADALGTDAPSLLMRLPENGESLWSVWDHATQGERQMIVEIVRTITKKTGT